MKARLLTAIAVVFATVPFVLAQAPAATPTFEVASVKRNLRPPVREDFANRANVTTLPKAGQLVINNYTLSLLVRTAYQIELEHISGGPSWRDNERFNIEAKAAGPVANEGVLFQMLQTLLADRFRLKMHLESKEVPAYALVVAKSGLKLRPRTTSPAPPGARDVPAPPQRTGGFSRGGPCLDCGSLRVKGEAAGPRAITGTASMSELANFLSRQTGRPVVDRTGTAGVFDITIEWDVEPDELRTPGAADVRMMSAMQNQLGLRLEEAKGEGQRLVIDAVERPAEN